MSEPHGHTSLIGFTCSGDFYPSSALVTDEHLAVPGATHQPKLPHIKMSNSRRKSRRPPSPPSTPSLLRSTAIPHIFFTRHTDTTPEPAPNFQPKAPSSAHSNELHTNNAAVTLDLTQATSTSSATAHHPQTAQVDESNASTYPTACFLGIPLEVRCMIYDLLWIPKVDIYIDPSSISHPNPVHPVFRVNRQVRSEAIDNLQRRKPTTLHIHAIAKDLDFTETTSTLEDLDKNQYFEKRGGSKWKLQIRLSLHHEDQWRLPPAPESFATFLVLLKKLDVKPKYEYAFTDKDGEEADASFARGLIVGRINLLNKVAEPSVECWRAAYEMETGYPW